MRLLPQPDPSELPQYYPENYWFAPGETAAGELEALYRRIVIRDHVNFVRRAVEAFEEAAPAASAPRLGRARSGRRQTNKEPLSSSKEGLVLDVGCGGGLFLRMLAESGLPVVGLDSSLDAAILAWSQNGVPTVCGSLSRAPFAPNTCAAVTMFHVLEHLYRPLSYLEAARELLCPEGRLIVQVPNAACWQFLLLGERWSGLDVPRHLYQFRARDLEILLNQAGFEVLRTKHFSLRDNPAGLATSLAPWLDPMARRVRRVRESDNGKLLKDLLYFGLVVASLPVAVLEAACGAGSTIMVEARKKS
jgi:2-polyprenyl-3-methyl-5-hydroxy-6-metoxy-1,4-benzoquinol methylase